MKTKEDIIQEMRAEYEALQIRVALLREALEAEGLLTPTPAPQAAPSEPPAARAAPAPGKRGRAGARAQKVPWAEVRERIKRAFPAGREFTRNTASLATGLNRGQINRAMNRMVYFKDVVIVRTVSGRAPIDTSVYKFPPTPAEG